MLQTETGASYKYAASIFTFENTESQQAFPPKRRYHPATAHDTKAQKIALANTGSYNEIL
jgi:hypothetical protein